MKNQIKSSNQKINEELKLLVEMGLSFLSLQDSEISITITDEDRINACKEALLSYLMFLETGEKIFLFSERSTEILDEIEKNNSIYVN